jgi:hypothetical protein
VCLSMFLCVCVMSVFSCDCVCVSVSPSDCVIFVENVYYTR